VVAVSGTSFGSQSRDKTNIDIFGEENCLLEMGGKKATNHQEY